MPQYYVQNFSHASGGNSTFYAAMGAHNHNRSNQFTTDIKDWLQTTWHWQKGAVTPGQFLSHQGKPLQGHEMVWSDAKNKWVKA